MQVGTRYRVLDKHRDHEIAFVLTRKYDQFRDLGKTTLAIRSPYVKKALRKVIVRYPGVDFRAAVVVLDGPPRCLFHYRKKLKKYLETLSDEEAKKHLEFLLKHMYRVFDSELETWSNLMESSGVAPTINYFGLWMAFKPGDNIYLRNDGKGERVMRLKNISRCECTKPFCWQARWKLELEMIIFDGGKFGYKDFNFSIPLYDGNMRLSILKYFPLRYHPYRDRISKMLVASGEKYARFISTHHQFYDGTAVVASEWLDNEAPVSFYTSTTLNTICLTNFCR